MKGLLGRPLRYGPAEAAESLVTLSNDAGVLNYTSGATLTLESSWLTLRILCYARAIIVCVDDKKTATRIVESTRHYCPQVKLLVRAFDREHALELVKHDADYIVRETFESALLLGRQAVVTLGASEREADAVIDEVCKRDAERFALETSGGLFAGRALVLGNIERIDPPNQEARDAQ